MLSKIEINGAQKSTSGVVEESKGSKGSKSDLSTADLPKKSLQTGTLTKLLYKRFFLWNAHFQLFKLLTIS